MILANEPPTTQFPIMPKFHRDRLPILTVTKTLDKTKRIVLQLWQSDYLAEHHNALWVGTLRLEEANHPLPLITLFLEQPYYGDLLKSLLRDSKDKEVNTNILLKRNGYSHEILLLKWV